MVTVPNFYLAMFGRNDVEVYKYLAQIIIKSSPAGSKPGSLTYVAPHVAAYDQEKTPVGHANRKIKVGFTSMFFRDHASGKMIQGIIQNLSRSKFHVTVFSIKEPGDRKPYTGAIAERIRAAADK